MRQLLSRTLMVIGGAAAVTAAAWVFSSAAASAETHNSPSLAPITGTVVSNSPESASAAAGVHELNSTIATVMSPSTKTASPLSKSDQLQAVMGQAPRSADLDELHRQVSTVVNKTQDGLAAAPQELIKGSLDAIQHVTQLPVDKLTDLKLPVSGLIGSSHVAAERSVAPDAAQAALGAPVSAQIVGKSSDGGHSLSDLDRVLSSLRSMGESKPSNHAPTLPTIPVGTPASVCCSAGFLTSGFSGGSSSAGLPISGALSSDSAFRALSLSSGSVAVSPGKQPGITPD